MATKKKAPAKPVKAVGGMVDGKNGRGEDLLAWARKMGREAEKAKKAAAKKK